MNRLAIAAAGAMVLAAWLPTSAHAQCWWTGFNYVCSAPLSHAPRYSPFWYGYGHEPWWRFGYDDYEY